MNERVKNFIIEHQEEINYNNWEDLYKELDKHPGNSGPRYIKAEFSEALFDAGINPLKYMREVPTDFAHSSSTIEYVEIPDQVTRINEDAFRGSEKLSHVSIGKNVTSIGSDAFSGCDSLTSITIPDSVISIGEGAFSLNPSLIEVVIGSGVKVIEKEAFFLCEKLTKVMIGNGVEKIESYIFGAGKKLNEIIYNGTKSQWNAIEKSSAWRVKSGLKKIICIDGEITLK